MSHFVFYFNKLLNLYHIINGHIPDNPFCQTSDIKLCPTTRKCRFSYNMLVIVKVKPTTVNTLKHSQNYSLLFLWLIVITLRVIMIIRTHLLQVTFSVSAVHAFRSGSQSEFEKQILRNIDIDHKYLTLISHFQRTSFSHCVKFCMKE